MFWKPETRASGTRVQAIRRVTSPSRQMSKNAESVATTADRHEEEDFHDELVPHDTTKKVSQILQQCSVKGETFEQDLHRTS